MKKKILFTIDNLNGGGAEKSLSTLLNKFDLEKYDITLFLLSKEGIFLDDIRYNIKLKYLFDLTGSKAKVILNKSLRKIMFTLISKSLLMSKIQKIISYIIDEEYDTYIAFMEGISTKVVGMIANESKNKIAWVHTDVSEYKWYSRYYTSYREEKLFYSKYSHIVCVSNDAKNGFEKAYFKDNRIKVIYNILDKNLIETKSLEALKIEGDFKICCVGRLEYEKGQEMLIRAFSKLEGNNNLYIIGEGSKKNELKKLCKDLSVSHNVVFVGFDTNPYKYIKNCDVVVSPSRNEGFSLVVAESIILNKMVISTKCSGPIEILNNGEFGVLVNDEYELARILKEILLDKSIINKYEKLAESRSMIFNANTNLNQIYQII